MYNIQNATLLHIITLKKENSWIKFIELFQLLTPTRIKFFEIKLID